jgi:hypothetical protein
MEYLVFALVILAFIIALMLLGYIGEKRRWRQFRDALKSSYGATLHRRYQAGQYENISHYFREHQDGFHIDDLTWHDLDMDTIFRRLNYTHSSAGEEYLYYMLRTPLCDETELKRREELITFFQENEEERVTWQCLYAGLGRTGKYTLYDYLGYLDDLGRRANWPHIFAILAFFAAIIITALAPVAGIIALLAVLTANLLSYFHHKKDIDPYIVCFSYIFRLLEWVKKAERQSCDILKGLTGEAAECGAALLDFQRGSYLLMSPTRFQGSNPADLILDYLRMALHLDLLKFNHMLAEVKKHRAEIDRMVTIIGQIEAMIAIGVFRANLQRRAESEGEGGGQPTGSTSDNSSSQANANLLANASLLAYCTPVFTAEKQIVCEDIYHPLLTKPVKNSVTIAKSFLLTGSNASGKSTFLKTIAINAIMAQSIHTCTAASYTASFFRIATSMSLKDDIIAGDSYYMAEIKAMKRLLDLGKDGDHPALVLADEVLRGTNTGERIAASTQILKSLNHENSLCLAATHDIELTALLAGEYENYHFEERWENDDIHFPYLLLPGPATTQNAIKLLRVMGYDEGLVQAAENALRERTK